MKKCGAKREMVENSDKMWSTGEGNGKPLQYFCLENPMSSIKRREIEVYIFLLYCF